jgi:hypothetical protein
MPFIISNFKLSQLNLLNVQNLSNRKNIKGEKKRQALAELGQVQAQAQNYIVNKGIFIPKYGGVSCWFYLIMR